MLRRTPYSLTFALTLTGLALVGTACGKAVSTPIADDDWANPGRTAYEVPPEDRAGDDADVRCDERAAHCSPSVGMLVGTLGERKWQCTSFLVAPDLLATNSHCVPADLTAPNAACAGRIRVHFPRVDAAHPAESADCARVIRVSPPTGENGLGPDFAFLRLQRPVARPPLAVSHAGLPDGAGFTAWKIEWRRGLGHPAGTLRADRCFVRHDTLVGPERASTRGETVAVGDCAIDFGNSGSPLVDEQGRVHAIVHGTLTLNPERIAAGLAKVKVAMPAEPLATLGMVTNLACVQLPDETAPADPVCTRNGSARAVPRRSHDERALKHTAQREIDRRSSGFDPQASYGWTVGLLPVAARRAGEPALVLPLPACAKKSGVDASRTYVLPAWQLGPQIVNRSLQVETTLVEDAGGVTLRVETRAPVTPGARPQVSVTREVESASSPVSLLAGEIDYCPAAR